MHELTLQLAADVRRARSLGEQIRLLANRFEDAICVVATSGPSLRTVPPEPLRQALQGVPTIVVKQAIDIVGDQADFHCWNSFNVAKFGKGAPETIRCLVTEPTGRMVQWNKSDMRFPLVPNDGDIRHSLALRRNFDDYLLSHSESRPFGPGIMYELVLYLAVHLGVKEIITIGWDIASAEPAGPYTHFYDLDDRPPRGPEIAASGAREWGRSRVPEPLHRVVRSARTARLHHGGQIYNRTKPLPGEFELVSTSTSAAAEWLNRMGVSWRAVTDSPHLDPRIGRLSIEDLFDHLSDRPGG